MPNKLSALVLAAGLSRRMGRNKSLLPLGGRSVLECVLAAVTAAEPDEILVVLGPGGEAVIERLDLTPATIVWNRESGSEMADSLRAALRRLPPDGRSVMICLGDQPLIEPATYRRLAAAHRARPESILQPQRKGRRGHPVLLPQGLLQEIQHQPTLRHVLAAQSEKIHPLEIDDPGILLDLDSPEDYRKVLRLWERRQSGNKQS